MKIFAAFVVVVLPNGMIAATTRAADRGETGKIGLPGGKLRPSETARDAAIREAQEEGWRVRSVASTPFHTAIVDGKPIAWFMARDAWISQKKHKEVGRVGPIEATIEELLASGYGNDKALSSPIIASHLGILRGASALAK